MKIIKKIIDWITDCFSSYEPKCPICNGETELYGSHPWGYFYNRCEKCNRDIHNYNER